MKKMCLTCKKEFFTRCSKRKFCSHPCYISTVKGRVRSEETCEKLRKSLLGTRFSPERKKNIGLARQKHLSKSEMDSLKELLDFGMPDGYIMENLGISQKVYLRYKKELYPSGIPWQCKWLEKDVEKVVIEEIIKLTRLGYRYKRIAQYVGLHHKTIKLILTALNKRDSTIKCLPYDDESWKNRKESGPEKLIREFLESRNIEYRQEAQLETGSKWYFDFHILKTNLLLEVQGDYWHCNPVLYLKPINDYQKWSIKRDFAKKDYAKKLGYKVYPIWENDIKTDFEQSKQCLEKRIEECRL